MSKINSKYREIRKAKFTDINSVISAGNASRMISEDTNIFDLNTTNVTISSGLRSLDVTRGDFWRAKRFNCFEC